MVNESGKLKKIGEMRRKRQALPQARCEEILRCGSAGVLAVLGYEGYPYAVPLSYVWHKRSVAGAACSGRAVLFGQLMEYEKVRRFLKKA